MFDVARRRHFESITVKDLIVELSKMPQDAEVLCCGDNYMWLHVEDDETVVCIDVEDLEECYDLD